MNEVKLHYCQTKVKEIWHERILKNLIQNLIQQRNIGLISNQTHGQVIIALRSGVNDLMHNPPAHLKVYLTKCDLMDELVFSARGAQGIRGNLLHGQVQLSMMEKEWPFNKKAWVNQLNHSIEISRLSQTAGELFFNELLLSLNQSTPAASGKIEQETSSSHFFFRPPHSG